MPSHSLKIVLTNARSWWLSSGKSKSEINRALRESGVEVGKLWARKFALQHFAPGATHRYGYGQRSTRWNTFKLHAQEYYDYKEKMWYPIVKPQPWNLVCTGRFKDTFETKRFGWNVSSTATGTKSGEQNIVVSVRIPLPHPLNPRYSSSGFKKPGMGELVRIIRAESQEMGRLLLLRAMEKLGRVPPGQMGMKFPE